MANNKLIKLKLKSQKICPQQPYIDNILPLLGNFYVLLKELIPKYYTMHFWEHTSQLSCTLYTCALFQ